MKTKILIAILTVGVFSISTMKAQEKPMKMKNDSMKMDHSKMKMMDKSVEVEIKHELMEIDNMYTCPMHGDVKSDKPGACPKCNMDLLKVTDTKSPSCCAGMKKDSTKMECGMNHDKMAEMYACPMKCEGEKTYDKAGSCPKCKMDLKNMEMKMDSTKMNMDHSGMDHSKMEMKNDSNKIVNTYACPMHADVTSDKPSTCPKCGMDLKKTDVKKADTPKKHKH